MRYATSSAPSKPSYADEELRARHRERNRRPSREPNDRGDVDSRIDAALDLAMKNKKNDDNNKNDDNQKPQQHPTKATPKENKKPQDLGTNKLSQKKPHDPMKPTAYAVRTIPFVLKKLQKFVLSPGPSGGGVVVRCFIERNRSGTNALFPVYKLYTDHEDGTGRFIMAARKMPSSTTSHYAFSTSTGDLFKSRNARSRNYLGKLRGDAATATYTLYDRGVKPDATHLVQQNRTFHARSSGAQQYPGNGMASPRSFQNGKFDAEPRCELACIAFSARRGRRSSNPRHLEVALPQTRFRPRNASDPPCDDPDTDDGGVTSVETVQPFREQDGLEHMLTLIQGQGAQNVLYADRAVVLHMRESKYDPLSSCLVDFKARASMASSKNFQLIKSPPLEPHMKRAYYAKPNGEGAHLDPKQENDPQPVILQMGKVGKHCFNMDFQFPLSMFQAFAICIARFDTRVPIT